MINVDEMKQQMAAMSTRYADAEQCECGALIECLDGGGYSYWLHVKRMRIDYDHAAVPVSNEGSLIGKIRMISALADRYALDGGDIRKRDVAATLRALLAD